MQFSFSTSYICRINRSWQFSAQWLSVKFTKRYYRHTDAEKCYEFCAQFLETLFKDESINSKKERSFMISFLDKEKHGAINSVIWSPWKKAVLTWSIPLIFQFSLQKLFRKSFFSFEHKLASQPSSNVNICWEFSYLHHGFGKCVFLANYKTTVENCKIFECLFISRLKYDIMRERTYSLE